MNYEEYKKSLSKLDIDAILDLNTAYTFLIANLINSYSHLSLGKPEMTFKLAKDLKEAVVAERFEDENGQQFLKVQLVKTDINNLN